MQRTNPNADNANMIKLFTPRLCKKEEVYGTVAEDTGNIAISFEEFLKDVAITGATFTATSSDGVVTTHRADIQDLVDQSFTLFAHAGVGPWIVTGRLENAPNNGCACLPEFSVTVGVGGEVEFDQRLDGMPQISGTVSKAIGTEPFVFGSNAQIELDLTSEAIEEGDVYAPNITLTNSGVAPLFVIAQTMQGSVTASNLNNTPVFVIQPGQTLPFGSFTLDTAAAGSKTVEVILYTNAAPVALRTLSINYTVIP
jgi:hypothetical protein